MYRTDRSNRSLPISPLVWVAVAVLGCVSLYESLPKDPASNTLEYLHPDKPVVVRLSDESFDFPLLGARIVPPPDWVHLSTTNPALAQHPTFLNVKEHLVLTILPDQIASDSVAQDDKQATTIQRFDEIEIQWQPGTGTPLSMDANLDGFRFPIRWNLLPVSRIGRLQSDKLRLILVAHGSGNGVGTDADFGFRKAIADFCRRIRPLPLD